MRTQSKIFDEAVYKALKGTEPDVAISTTNIEIGAKGGGGLSDLNETLMIKGQPHNLAWINRDEASVLKAMGGSGKKVGGIPAYYYGAFGEDVDDSTKSYGMTEGGRGSDFSPFADSDIDYSVETETGEGLWKGGEELASLYEGIDKVYKDANVKPVPEFDDWQSMLRYNPNPSDDPTEYQKIYDRPELDIYKTKLIERLGVPGMESYIKGLGTSGLRQMVDKFHTGYDFGGPMGTMEGLTRDIGTDYAEKLDLKKLAEELKELKEKNLSDEDFEIRKGEILSRYQGIADDLGGKFIPQKEFKGMYGDFDKTLEKSGLKGTLAGTALDFLKPGTLFDKGISAGLNALTKAFGVVGEFTTPEGKTFRVKDDGTLVEPDMPPDPSSVDEGNIEVKVKDKYDYFGESTPSIVTKEEEKDLGISDVFKRKSKRPESNIFLSDLLDTIYGEGQGQQMLG